MAYIASCRWVWAQGYYECIRTCWAGQHKLVDGLNTNELIVILQLFRYWWRCAYYILGTVYQNETAIGWASAPRYQRIVFS